MFANEEILNKSVRNGFLVIDLFFNKDYKYLKYCKTGHNINEILDTSTFMKNRVMHCTAYTNCSVITSSMSLI